MTYLRDKEELKFIVFSFLFDGRRINDDDTPKTLEMEEDDVIEVCLERGHGLRGIPDSFSYTLCCRSTKNNSVAHADWSFKPTTPVPCSHLDSFDFWLLFLMKMLTFLYRKP